MRLNYIKEWFMNFNTGMLSFLFQRLTGIALVLYLFLHLLTIGAVRNGDIAFHDSIRAYDNFSGHIIEWLLLVCVLFHLINGLRIVAVDLLAMTRSQKPIFWGGVVVMIFISIVSIIVFIPEVMP
jgi:succinate dehydrogenase / fumarate reductase cytochrome b subunit